MNGRRHDIDWLRVLAIGFLLIYHIAIPFQPWGVFIGFIQNAEPIESLWIPMSFLNVWRIPLLFFVSGMGVYFSMRKRNWKELLKERSLRILVPFIAGTLFIVPLQSLLWQVYYNQELTPMIFPAHLWFLGNIFSYVLLLLPVLYYLKRNEERLKSKFAKVLNHPVKLIFFTVPFALAALVANPESYATYAFNLHGYLLGFIAFFLGYAFVYSGEVFWATVSTWKWAFTAFGATLYFIRLAYFDMEGPLYLMSLEMIVWIYAIMGIGHSYLRFSNRRLTYLSEAAYPVYIVHWLFIHLAAFWLFPMELSAWIKLLGVIVITFGGSLALYHFVIRPVRILRPLFGLKTKKKQRRESLSNLKTSNVL